MQMGWFYYSVAFQFSLCFTFHWQCSLLILFKIVFLVAEGDKQLNYMWQIKSIKNMQFLKKNSK